MCTALPSTQPRTVRLLLPGPAASIVLGMSFTKSSMVVRKSAGRDCSVGKVTEPRREPLDCTAAKYALSLSLSTMFSRYSSRAWGEKGRCCECEMKEV